MGIVIGGFGVVGWLVDRLYSLVDYGFKASIEFGYHAVDNMIKMLLFKQNVTTDAN